MKNNKSKIKSCRHSTRLMTDMLAGEISGKDKKALTQRLDSCESCRAKFADLENAWSLTAVLLKESGEILTQRRKEAKTQGGEEEEALGIRHEALGGEGENIEHRTSNVQHRMEEGKDGRKKAEKKNTAEPWRDALVASESQKQKHRIEDGKDGGLKKKEKKKAGFKFAYGEIAASIILIFVLLGIFVGGYSISSTKLSQVNYLGGGNKDLNDIALSPIEIRMPEEFSIERPGTEKENVDAVVKDVIIDAPIADSFNVKPSNSALKMPALYGRRSQKKAKKRDGGFYDGKSSEQQLTNRQKNAPKGKPLDFGVFGSRSSRGRKSAMKRYVPKAKRRQRPSRIMKEKKAAADKDDDFLADESEEEGFNAKSQRSKVAKGGIYGGEGLSQPAKEEVESQRSDVGRDTAKPWRDALAVSESQQEEGGKETPNIQHRTSNIEWKRGKSLHRRREKAEEKLLKDPYNMKATEGLKKLYKKLRKQGAERRENDALERTAEVQWKWSEAVLPLPAKRPAGKSELKGAGTAGKYKIDKQKAQEELQQIIGDFRKREEEGKSEIDSVDSNSINAPIVAMKPKKDFIDAPQQKKRPKRSMNDKVSTALTKVSSMFVPQLSMARENARKISCTNNLKQIGLSLRMYSNVYSEAFPEKHGAAGLDQLRSNGFLENPRVYICPSMATECAKPGEPFTEETVSYMYVGGLTEASSVDLPIAFDKLNNHENFGNILFIDGHVKGYILKEFKNKIAKVAELLKKKPIDIQTKTLKANLKLWDMKTAQGVVDFLSKHKINIGDGSFEIDGDSVTFKLPAKEMGRVEKLFFEFNKAEEKMNESKDGLPFLRTKQKPFSTFSIDVDTASYTRVAKEIRQGKRPSSASVRAEEFVNYFDYHYRSPKSSVFGVELEAAPSTFRPSNTLLRVGVQGKRLGSEVKRPSAFTILIDSSGSMANKNRLELVKESIPMLLSQLRPKDRVSVISCGSTIDRIVPFTSAKNKERIIDAVSRIEPLGVTNIEKGIIYAYKSAARNYVAGGYNRVLLFTDGISNISMASAEEILKQIETARKKGITNTVLSVGGDGDDALLEGIADKGDGSYLFLEDRESAKELFENQFSARFREIARDVKIQVEFNPMWVREYRQVGYKNRQLSKSDFRNDKVDAGEVGAGQSVTALYELKVNRIMPMRQTAQNIYPPPDTTIATVRIRYRRADNMEIEEREFSIRLQDIIPTYAGASSGFKLASAVAEFAEHLKYPETVGIANYNMTRRVLRPLISTTYANDKKVRELDNLVRLAK